MVFLEEGVVFGCPAKAVYPIRNILTGRLFFRLCKAYTLFLCNGTVEEKSRQSIATAEYWGREHVEGLLQILARLQLHSTEDFAVYLQNVYADVTSTDIVIVTAYLSRELLDFAARKEQEGAHVKFLASAPLLGDLDWSGFDVAVVTAEKEGEA